MAQIVETASIAVALLVCWATATAVGLGVGAVVARRRGSARLLTVGGVLGSVGSSVAPIAIAIGDEGDTGHWGIVTALLAAMGSFTGSLAAVDVGRGILAALPLGARSGCLSGGVMGICYAGLSIATNQGHPYSLIAAPVFILLAVAVGTAYGTLFSLLLAFGWWMIRGPSPDSPGAKPLKLNDQSDVVRLWLAGQRPFILAAREQDLDAILESTFPVDTLVEFYETQGALPERRFWIAFALWQSMGLRIDPDKSGDYDAAETDRLRAFITMNLKEFQLLGLGNDPECPLVRYLADGDSSGKPLA